MKNDIKQLEKALKDFDSIANLPDSVFDKIAILEKRLSMINDFYRTCCDLNVDLEKITALLEKINIDDLVSMVKNVDRFNKALIMLEQE